MNPKKKLYALIGCLGAAFFVIQFLVVFGLQAEAENRLNSVQPARGNYRCFRDGEKLLCSKAIEARQVAVAFTAQTENKSPGFSLPLEIENILLNKTENEDQFRVMRNSLVRRLNRQSRKGDVSLQDMQEAVDEIFKALEDKNPPVNPYNKFGPYLTSSRAANEAFFEDTLEKMAKEESPALVFDVKGSFIYFYSHSPKAAELKMVRPLYDLPAIVGQAREKGVYTIARYIAIKDEVLVKNYPEMAVRLPDSNRNIGLGWIEPDNPEALEYNRQILKEVAQSGVDEINLDYIRYSTTLPQTLAKISRELKTQKLLTFLQMAREAINEAGSATKLGISTYAILGWDFELNVKNLGQDVIQFAPLVDVISPMAYPATFSYGGYYNPAKHPRSRMYYLVYRTLTGYQELLKDQAYKLRPWIQGYYASAWEIREEIDAVFDAGLCGFTVWNANANYANLYRALDDWKMPAHCLTEDYSEKQNEAESTTEETEEAIPTEDEISEVEIN